MQSAAAYGDGSAVVFLLIEYMGDGEKVKLWSLKWSAGLPLAGTDMHASVNIDAVMDLLMVTSHSR
jgi:hypothetical protein